MTSSCEKSMQILKNILKFSPFPQRLTDGRSSSSHSPPNRHHPLVKPPKSMTSKLQNRRRADGFDRRKSSSFIKIQGTDDKDIRRVDGVNGYESTRTSELEVAVTNLMVSDYIKNFHERNNSNKHEAVSKLVNTLASGDRGQGFDPYPLKARGSFPTFGRTGRSLSTFGRGRAVYVSTSLIHRGRRQGDPMSPCLFTLVMEIFTLLMMKNVKGNSKFKYRRDCKEVKLTNLCFADDLLVVWHGDVDSVRSVKDTMMEFSAISGLMPNMEEKNTLWVKWVKMVKLRGESIWEVQKGANDSWMWKCLLELRNKIRKHTFKVLGDGKNTKFWVDQWNSEGILSEIINWKDIYDARLSGNESVLDTDIYDARLSGKESVWDMVEGYKWSWPEDRTLKYPILKDWPREGLTHFFEYKVPCTGECTIRSSSSRSPPHRHHPSIKSPRNMKPKLQNRRKMDDLDREKSSSFIKIQGTDDKDIRTVDDVNRYESTRTSELEVAVTNLMVSDYIKNFHERNKHEAVSLVLPPPPQVPPRFR
uniref:RNA-directed DNA polymerase, eukaryota, reverse transcriptase zinc-binding domain protein n=1 Tax=Tanacetum cinerariifolium TaxID=118510 RepID=A0A6L2NAX7_TANCI|nr:RNA-directed DNA polymerase, eukaryota, reverse transcriptase zinc-binding domain protein [Tanacetum cinerariifolium]